MRNVIKIIIIIIKRKKERKKEGLGLDWDRSVCSPNRMDLKILK